MALRSAVHRLGLRFRVDRKMQGTSRRADLVFIFAKVAVFVDGCFWHGCPIHRTWPRANADWWREKLEANVRRDRDTDASLRRLGWVVLRFWEHEDLVRAASSVARLVKRRPGN